MDEFCSELLLFDLGPHDTRIFGQWWDMYFPDERVTRVVVASVEQYRVCYGVRRDLALQTDLIALLDRYEAFTAVLYLGIRDEPSLRIDGVFLELLRVDGPGMARGRMHIRHNNVYYCVKG